MQARQLAEDAQRLTDILAAKDPQQKDEADPTTSSAQDRQTGEATRAKALADAATRITESLEKASSQRSQRANDPNSKVNQAELSAKIASDAKKLADALSTSAPSLAPRSQDAKPEDQSASPRAQSQRIAEDAKRLADSFAREREKTSAAERATDLAAGLKQTARQLAKALEPKSTPSTATPAANQANEREQLTAKLANDADKLSKSLETAANQISKDSQSTEATNSRTDDSAKQKITQAKQRAREIQRLSRDLAKASGNDGESPQTQRQTASNSSNSKPSQSGSQNSSPQDPSGKPNSSQPNPSKSVAKASTNNQQQSPSPPNSKRRNSDIGKIANQLADLQKASQDPSTDEAFKKRLQDWERSLARLSEPKTGDEKDSDGNGKRNRMKQLAEAVQKTLDASRQREKPNEQKQQSSQLAGKKAIDEVGRQCSSCGKRPVYIDEYEKLYEERDAGVGLEWSVLPFLEKLTKSTTEARNSVQEALKEDPTIDAEKVRAIAKKARRRIADGIRAAEELNQKASGTKREFLGLQCIALLEQGLKPASQEIASAENALAAEPLDAEAFRDPLLAASERLSYVLRQLDILLSDAKQQQVAEKIQKTVKELQQVSKAYTLMKREELQFLSAGFTPAYKTNHSVTGFSRADAEMIQAMYDRRKALWPKSLRS